ncbi:hypothetical protein KBD34_02605 [Patescibacteria group bacterium]|nr:hypothetical protein [Patescibacteria group bacterium]
MGIIGGILALSGFLPYIVEIVERKTKPNRASWLIWSVLGLVILATYLASPGSHHNLPATIALAIAPIVTMVLCIKYGEGSLSRFDKGCLIGAGLSLLVWNRLNSPILGLACALITDALGLIPTWRGISRDPTKEKPHAWIIWSVGNICNMFTIERLTIQDAVYPTYYLVGTGVSTFLILHGRWRAKQHNKTTIS